VIPTDPVEKLRRALESHLAVSRATGDSTPECLTDEQIAGLVDGRVDPSVRSAVVAHLSGCGVCRRAVSSVTRALGDRAIAAEVASLQRGRGRWLLMALPLAAAVLLLVVWRPTTPPVEIAHRGEPAGTALVPAPTAPVGTVAAARSLTWHAVAGADRYRVTLYSATGHVEYETQVDDTVAALPEAVIVVPGHSYYWKVDARVGWDRWVGSDLAEFTLSDMRP